MTMLRMINAPKMMSVRQFKLLVNISQVMGCSMRYNYT